MTDPSPAPERDVRPSAAGERRLARPPSERYGTTPADAAATAEPGAAAHHSPLRGIAFGSLTALVGAGMIVLFGGVLAVSAGLLVVAAAIGYAVGIATVAGARDTLSGRARPWSAAAMAGLGAAIGQVGLWLFAWQSGGVLAPIDYLAQTFGPLVPIELLLAAGVAWWRAR